MSKDICIAGSWISGCIFQWFDRNFKKVYFYRTPSVAPSLKESFSKKLFCSINILRLHPAILLKDEHKYFLIAFTYLSTTYFLEHRLVAASETKKCRKKVTKDVNIKCVVPARAILVEDQQNCSIFCNFCNFCKACKFMQILRFLEYISRCLAQRLRYNLLDIALVFRLALN